MSIRVLAVVLAAFLLPAAAFSQRGGRGGGSSASSSAKFDFYGKVALEDGTVPSFKVMIESICNGVAYQEMQIGKDGKFRFTLSNSNATVDASVKSLSDSPVLPECNIRASAPGYKSDSINLYERNYSNERAVAQNPDLGTIVLRKPTGAEAASVSATSQKASKDAKKAFDKGVSGAKDKKWDEAAKNYQKAVELYPEYAEAWFRLGEAQQGQNQADAARKSFETAIKIDANYLPPYAPLVNMEAQAQNWKNVAEMTDRMIKLAPGMPRIYLLNSIAYLTLRDVDSAERSIRAGLKSDLKGELPRLHQMMGAVLANKGDFAGAVSEFNQYLEKAPFANDAATVRQQVEQLKARAATPPPAKK